MASPVVLKQLMASSRRLVVPFRPAVATDMFDCFSTTSRRMYSKVSLTPEYKTLKSSKQEDEDNVYLNASMPGFEKEDVNVSVSRYTPDLIIDAEKREGFEVTRYGANFDLPEDINVTGIKQELKAGILKITLPKLKKDEINDGELQIKIN